MDEKRTIALNVEELEERIAPGIVSGALAAAGQGPPPGVSGAHFNGDVAADIWLGRAGGAF